MRGEPDGTARGFAVKLAYANVNTYLIRGDGTYLLVDTGYAGTLPLFFKAIKAAGVDLCGIGYVLATHFHPDHAGLIGELQKSGVTLALADVQLPHVHFADAVFARDRRLSFTPANEGAARVFQTSRSREFLASLGIDGEIVHTPSHSPDSVSLILDCGDAIVGDLEPLSYLAGYDGNRALEADWERVLALGPKRVLHAHANETTL